MDNTKYYNNHAVEFFNRTVNLNMGYIYIEFLKHVKYKDHILDAGCGSGRDSLYFKNKGYKVTALDASEELVKLSSRFLN